MEIFKTLDEAKTYASQRDYVLGACGDDGVFVKTPIFTAHCNTETSRHKEVPEYGYFAYNLPKISISYLGAIVRFFKEVAERYSLEAYCELRRTSGGYRISIPEQKCSHTAVTYEPEQESLDDFTVISIHSHNFMPAFFSSIDDRDECGKRLYLVCGDLGAQRPKILMRAGAGGSLFTYIDPNEVFTMEVQELCDEQIPSLFREWERKAVLL